MAFLDFIKRNRNKLEDPNVPMTPELVAAMLSGNFSNRISNSVPLAADVALSYSAVFRSVRILADAISTLEPKVYDESAGTKILSADHKLADLLSDPNDLMTGEILLDKIVTEVELLGNSYVLILRDNANRAIGLLPFRPGEVTVRIQNSRKVYTYSGSFGSGTIDSSDILHFYFYTGDGYTGLSTLRYAGEAVQYGLSLETYGKNLIEGGASHTGILTSEAKLSPEQISQLKKEWTEYQGTGGAGKTPILHGVKYQQVSMSVADAQFLETRKFSVQEIARFFGVPPHLLFELGSSNYATSENLSLEFYKFSLRPKLKKIAAEIAKKLLTSGFCLEFDAAPLTAGDTAARTAFVVAGLQSGFLTKNEARAEFNLPPKAGGDDLQTPLNMGNAGGNPVASKNDPENPIETNTEKGSESNGQ